MKKHVLPASVAAGGGNRFDWGTITWLASAALDNAKAITLGRVVIRPGCRNPAHAHNTTEEILYLLKGRLEHRLGTDTVVVEAGDTLTVPPGVFHQAFNTGTEDADMIVAYPKGDRDFVPEQSGDRP